MHVLFVTESRFDRSPSGDGSTRYRCFNVAEALIAAGHRVTVGSLAEIMIERIGQYDVISVLRPRAGRRLKNLVRAARRHKIRLVADFDDLIFDVDAAVESPLVLNNFADSKTVARGFQRFATACSWFDEITVSTRPLADAAERCFAGTPVYLLANGLSLRWLKHADELLSSREISADSVGQSISYLPGTRSHDADFRSIQAAVSSWLSVDDQRTLRIVGELSVDEQLAAGHQVVREALVPFFQLPEKIVNSGVTLAPLIDNKFNRAKSHIKFLESAAFGVPVVATANPDIEQHRGIEGLLCPESEADWTDALVLATRQSGNAGIRQGLKNYVRNGWTTVETSKPSLERWQQLVNNTLCSDPNEAGTISDNNPDAFFLSLRPVPRSYTLKGWRPDKPTNLVVFESDSLTEFDRLNFAELEHRVLATGSSRDQWLVLVGESATRPMRNQWVVQLRRWRATAGHIEIVHARTAADRCSLIHQCDRVLWLTPDTCIDGLLLQRSRTPLEIFQITFDRWCRKARKFRESPRRFFADSRILSTAVR